MTRRDFNVSGNQPIGVAHAVFVLSFMVLVLCGSMLLWAEPPKGETWQYWLTGAAGVLLVLSGVAIFIRSRRKDLYPDVLSILPLEPFECAGVLLVPKFSPLPARAGGVLRQALFYQNRYDAPAVLEVTMRPGASWKLEVAPGEVGLVWEDIPVSVPEGKASLRVDIVGSGTREGGREVRLRTGRLLNDPGKLDTLTIAGALAGVAVTKQAARIDIPISGQAPPGPKAHPPKGRLTVWRPDSGREEIRRSLMTACSVAGL